MLPAERTIPFTKPHTKQHRNKAGWNEHVSKEFDHALHWHRLYLQHGRPQSGFTFEMRKFTRSIYHKKVKRIDSNQKRKKKTRIAKGFLENKSRNYNLYRTINNKICNECINHTVDVNDVENAINKLKPGKSDGFDCLTSDYLMNASSLCFGYLSYLFTTMLYHCFTPKSLYNSTMIPIPKGSNNDTANIKNYRCIALSSVLSKVFDSCII